MFPLVSIIIPAYNAELWISETIKSAFDQIWANTEIIVVDDGSTDNTLKIVQEFSSTRLKVIAQKNAGAASARNSGLQVALGDYIQYLDADDLLAPDKIQKQIVALQNNDKKFVASGSWATFVTEITSCRFIPEKLWSDFTPLDWIYCLFERGGTMYPHAWLIPRNIVEKAGPWNVSLSLNDDREYFNRIVLASDGVVFCPDSKCYYRTGNSSVSLSKRRDVLAFESAWHVCELGIALLLETEDSVRSRRACATELVGFAIAFSVEFPEAVDLAKTRIRQLGVNNFVVPFGPRFQRAAKLFGWDNAIKIKRILYF